jgi:hypothetical protein
LPLIAIAIITLCFCPPLSWCGYLLNIAAGSGSFTFSKSSIVLRFDSCSSKAKCSRIASITWWPQVNTGFNDVIGSWKIIAISFPRTDCNSFSSIFKRSVCFFPSGEKRISPLIKLAFFVSNRNMASEVTDLPEPDSPAIPVISFLLMMRLMFCIADTFSVSVIKAISRFFISSNG